MTCGAIAGFIATVVGSPVDVVKTRVMNATNPDGSKKYKNVIECAYKTLRYEGVTAFYKGFGLNYLRLGTWNTIMFLTFEQLKIFFAKL